MTMGSKDKPESFRVAGLFTIASCFRMIIPKPIITQLNLTIIVLSLVFKRTLEVLFGKALTGVAIEVLFAFPYQLAFLVVGSSLVHSV